MHAGIFPLLMMALLQGLFTAPPQDFASLLKPLPVLEQLQVATNEASLLAVLAPTEAAARTTPAQLEQALKDLSGNTGYLKQLMAIRALQDMKSV